MQENWFQTACRKDIMLRSLKTSLLVGSALAVINHGDAVLAGNLEANSWLKIGLTYLVPYAVSTWASVQAVRTQEDPGVRLP